MWTKQQRYQALLQLKSRGWLSLRGVAILCNVTYVTAFDRFKKGKINTVEVGKVHRIYAEELCRILEIHFSDEPINAILHNFKERGSLGYE